MRPCAVHQNGTEVIRAPESADGIRVVGQEGRYKSYCAIPGPSGLVHRNPTRSAAVGEVGRVEVSDRWASAFDTVVRVNGTGIRSKDAGIKKGHRCLRSGSYAKHQKPERGEAAN